MTTGPAFMEVWREGDRAADAVARRRDRGDARTVEQLRDAVLQLAPLADGLTYDPVAMELVAAFEAALREVWEREAMTAVYCQARAAVRRSLEALADGKLL